MRTRLGRRAAAASQALGVQGGSADVGAGDELETVATAPAATKPQQACAEPGCGRPTYDAAMAPLEKIQ